VKIEKEELSRILSQFNPWWRADPIPDLPTWRRAAFDELYEWTIHPPAMRAVMLSGARQVGKTTLLMQVIATLLADQVPAANILYASFDHPILKLAGVDAVLEAWRDREPRQPGKEFVFLDEAQFIRDWGTWVKHQVDFNKSRQLIFTGSTLPLVKEGQESGVGRWHTIKLTTLSFFEYLQLTKSSLPPLPTLKSLEDLFHWDSSQIARVGETATGYVGHFHQYLLRGGFPQTALVDTVTQAQKLLRDDIIDKVLKRDMTALFGVRHVLDLEHTFLYLCLHDGGILDTQKLCVNLNVKRPTAQNFIDLLESTHLIYRLEPFGYGKEVLRGRFKIYISDPSIVPAVLLKGSTLLEDPNALGVAAESAVLKHLLSCHHRQNAKLSYWRKKEDVEVDFVVEFDGKVMPIEVKYRNDILPEYYRGLNQFCEAKTLSKGYLVTKSMKGFGSHILSQSQLHCFKIPAALLCYWLGEMELERKV
jgi:predicted AAA+ superfamily ATPase